MIFAFRLTMRWIIARNHFTAWPLASSGMYTASRVGPVCRCPLLPARLQSLLLLRSNQACNLLLGPSDSVLPYRCWLIQCAANCGKIHCNGRLLAALTLIHGLRSIGERLA